MTSPPPIKKTPQNWSQVLLEDGRKDDAAALAMYERALEADPEDVNALNNAALLLQNRLGHFGPAQDMFERAVKVCPNPKLSNTKIYTLGIWHCRRGCLNPRTLDHKLQTIKAQHQTRNSNLQTLTPKLETPHPAP